MEMIPFENFWTGCYAAIAVSNQALISIDELGTPSSTINQKGEALMTRAFSHFVLLHSLPNNMTNRLHRYIRVFLM